MDSERWQRIDDLYNSALSLDAEQRASWLAEVCADDDGLRQEVLSLLESADTEDSFLEEPALSLGLTVIGLESQRLIGESLDRYKILKMLGHGGMGEVYLAHDPRLNRQVAVKLLPASITEDRTRVHRFKQEAQLASKISHPNVAHIYEIGEAEARHYIAMEYVKGRTLRQVMREGELQADAAIEIAIQVATALSAAHRAGVIHRDIKPENILIADDGQVKVLDFGLAKLIEGQGEFQADLFSRPGSSFHTEPEMFMGTSHYMSPEQVRRQVVDFRTDLWSLGVVIYEMLTSRRPFLGETFSEVIIAIIEREPDFTGDEKSKLPPPAVTLLRRALEKQPQERYRDANELLADLRKIRESAASVFASTSSSSESANASATESTKRNSESSNTSGHGRMLTIPERLDTVQEEGTVRISSWPQFGRRLQVLLASVLVISAVAYYGVSSRRSKALVNSVMNLRFERLNLSGNINNITLSPDGKYVASVIAEGGLHSIHITELATASDLRVGSPSREGYSGISFSTDGTYVYYLENHAETGTLNRVSKLGGGQRKILEKVNTAVTFSPDGERMAFIRNNNSRDPADLVIAQADGSSEQVLVKRAMSDKDFFLSDMKGASPAWSPDGKVIACPTYNFARITQNDIDIVTVEGGASHRLNKSSWYDISRVAWLADGSGLIVAATHGPGEPYQLQLLAYPSGEVRQVTNDPNNYTLVSGSRDSGLFLTLNIEEDSNLWQVNLKDTQPTLLAEGQRKGLAAIQAAGAGRFLYTVSDGIHTNLWIEESGSARRQLTFEADNSKPMASPDGRYIVFVSKRAEGMNIWRVNSDGTQPTQLTKGKYEDLPVITPDSKWVIYRTGNAVKKVSIDGENSVQLFDKTALGIALSPSGEQLAFFTNDRPDSQIWHLEIYDLATLTEVKRFALPERTTPFNNVRLARDNRLQWVPDGSGIAYISHADGNSNIWLQPISSSKPRALTNFRDAEISSFSWSGNQQIVCVRNTKAFVPILMKLFN